MTNVGITLFFIKDNTLLSHKAYYKICVSFEDRHMLLATLYLFIYLFSFSLHLYSFLLRIVNLTLLKLLINKSKK